MVMQGQITIVKVMQGQVKVMQVGDSMVRMMLQRSRSEDVRSISVQPMGESIYLG